MAVSDHPKYGKYFRMLKVGLPREAIKAKMQHEGMNPAFLDKDPSEVIPIESPAGEDSGGGGGGSDVKVSVADHPTYAKYFKMMKVGLPKEAIKAKMQQEGVNPSFLDKDPTEMVSMVESKTAGGEGPSTRPKNPNAAAMSAIAGGISALGSKGVPKLRKKKLYWKALDASQVGRDSLWADKDDDITLDEAEFNQLFVERYELNCAHSLYHPTIPSTHPLTPSHSSPCPTPLPSSLSPFQLQCAVMTIS